MVRGLPAVYRHGRIPFGNQWKTGFHHPWLSLVRVAQDWAWPLHSHRSPLPSDGLLGDFINAKIKNQYAFVLSQWSLPVRDKLIFARTMFLAQLQTRQPLRPYQQLRYWSTVPFRHGTDDVVKYAATACAGNPARALQENNPNCLQDELSRPLQDDGQMSGFEFELQFLDADRMTYWGKRRDANFWIENASIEWNETEAPFHTVARLTLLPASQLPMDAGEATYFDVTGHATPDSTPLGSINRARRYGEVAGRTARLRADNSCEP